MSDVQAMDRINELNVLIPEEPDVMTRLFLIQERIDLRTQLGFREED